MTKEELLRENENLRQRLADSEVLEHQWVEVWQLNEARYRGIVEDQTEMICRFRPDGVLSFVNEAYCRDFAKTREELIGKNFKDLIPREDRKEVEKCISGLSQEHPIFTYEHRAIRDNNEIGWQEWTDRAILDENGNITEIQSVGRDISRRKKVEEELRQARDELEDIVKERTRELTKANQELRLLNDNLYNAFTNILDGIIIIDEEGRFRDLNPATEQIIGKPVDEMKGQHINFIGGGEAPYTERLLNEGVPYSEVEAIVDGENGRCHFMVSGVPIKDQEERINGGILFLRSMRKVQRLVNRFSGAHARFHFRDIIAKNEAMLETIRIASLAAASMGNILLEGESGTGKELFAQAIHNRSDRRREPFVALNCGAIPRELVSSELFGYTEGAFTGSRRGGNPGKFELASGGTLFLDEIGDMPLEQQTALLRVLQEKTIMRIGGDKVIPVDARVICATNKNLWREVGKGIFRQDLYYRLNVISLRIPPLRDRREDIPVLVEHFLQKLGARKGNISEYVEAGVIQYLKNYNWPGNVREVENVMERILSIAGDGKFCMEHLPPEIRHPHSPQISPQELLSSDLITMSKARENNRKILAERERSELQAFLKEYDGNVSRVAREIGVSRNTVYRKMRMHKIEND